MSESVVRRRLREAREEATAERLAVDAEAEVLDGIASPLSDEQMAKARRYVGFLRASASHDHNDTGRRWRARCTCGDEWPCQEQMALFEAADLMDEVVSELMVRRRYARPLTGLDKVRDAVRAARGGDAPPQIRGYA